jgi:N-acetylglutamate synthase-like GNAT family acetyltransferase
VNVPLRSIRRATLDDLPALIALWKLEQLPVADLERRFKEFQIAEGEGGELLGTVGVQVAGAEARVHSEVFAPFEYADPLRERFWERLKVMGENRGWVRVWTQLHANGWRQCGFDPASPEQLSKLPEAFGHVGSDPWYVIQLRAERVGGPSLDAELQMLKMAYQAENQQVLKKARVLRMVALVLAAGVTLWIVWWGYRLFQNRDQWMHH